MVEKKKKQTKQKKDGKPKVKDLTKGGGAELTDEELRGASGGMTVSCTGKKPTCQDLVIIRMHAKTLTVYA